jgi:hypothetical protein
MSDAPQPYLERFLFMMAGTVVMVICAIVLVALYGVLSRIYD